MNRRRSGPRYPSDRMGCASYGRRSWRATEFWFRRFRQPYQRILGRRRSRFRGDHLRPDRARAGACKAAERGTDKRRVRRRRGVSRSISGSPPRCRACAGDSYPGVGCRIGRKRHGPPRCLVRRVCGIRRCLRDIHRPEGRKGSGIVNNRRSRLRPDPLRRLQGAVFFAVVAACLAALLLLAVAVLVRSRKK